MMPCIRINEAQRDRLLQERFNPPSTDEDPGAFVIRLRNTVIAMKSELARHWTYGIGDEDFFIHAGNEGDRMLCVEITNCRMLTPLLLEVAHKALISCAPQYCVDYCNSWDFLTTADGDPFPDFNIFVFDDRILVYSEREDLVDRLGIQMQL